MREMNRGERERGYFGKFEKILSWLCVLKGVIRILREVF